jgi:hypothetical protein
VVGQTGRLAGIAFRLDAVRDGRAVLALDHEPGW